MENALSAIDLSDGTIAFCLAVAAPALTGAVIADLTRLRCIFWGAAIGALAGGLLAPSVSFARSTGPWERLLILTELNLQGAIPCALGGVAIAWIVTRGNQRKAPPERSV